MHSWLSNDRTPERLRTRAAIVLALSEGLSDREVARKLTVARQTVALWRRRVTEKGSAFTITTDAPGRGRKPSVPETARQAVCAAYRVAALDGRPRSVRDLAREFGMSPATVHRTLRAHLNQQELGELAGPRPPRAVSSLSTPHPAEAADKSAGAFSWD